jgi:DUF4097 and DUF4098 domain-containing protein YvlB
MGESPFNLAKIDEHHAIAADQVKDIEVSSTIGDVKILPHDGDKINVQMKGKFEKKNADNFKLSVSSYENKLKINVSQKRKVYFFSVFSGDYDLIVRLPRSEFQQLKVHSDAAEIALNNVQAEHIDLHTSLGDIFIKDTIGAVSARSEVGDIEVSLKNIADDITATSNVGDITIKTKQEPKNLRTDLRNSIGEEIMKLPNVKNGSIGNGGPLVILTSEVGDLALMMHDE